jgi:D-alanyl-D-alanine carboxypeptidase/D-alanyl-D-alanine-endopeptidase (penicillin-binding protein 4)
VRVFLLPLMTLPIGLLSMLLGIDDARPLQQSGLEPSALAVEWQSPWLVGLNPDPELDAIVDRYLDGLERQGWERSGQGIWIQAGNSAISAHQGGQLMSAASLTKLATSLAAVHTWPLDHRFETLVGISGPVEDGVLYGDLVIQGNGDPLFVWEEGIVLASQLQALGLTRITGDVLVIGDFTMNFQEDPGGSVADLGQVLYTDRWSNEVWEAYEALSTPVEVPTIAVEGRVRRAPASMGDRVTAWVLRHESLPLVAILKAMNIYSNNAMADMMAQLVGGPQAVVTQATQAADLPPGELSLVNGSGLGMENQMSARTAVAMLAALQQNLSQQGFSVVDVLPVSGEDVGTLIDRRIPEESAVKTGSLAEVSALAGMLPTAEKGPVWFAIINSGWAISDLRVQQDHLLQAIQTHWGKADMPPELTTKVRMQTGEYRFGDPARVQPVNPDEDPQQQ